VPVLTLLTSIYICIVDVRSHRIPNWSLLPLALSLVVDSSAPSFKVLTLTLSLLWSVGLLFGVGMGDIKLLSLLLLLQGSQILDFRYLLNACLVASVTIFFKLLMGSGLRGEVALAPTILIPFLLGYLGF